MLIFLLLIVFCFYSCSDQKQILEIEVDPEELAVDSIIVVNGIEYQISTQNPFLYKTHNNSLVYDFGKDAFGQLEVEIEGREGDTLKLAIGECLRDQHVDSQPHIFRRAQKVKILLEEGRHIYKPQMERIPYAEDVCALTMPKEIGEVLPFRYVEIENNNACKVTNLTRDVVTCPFNDNTSYFHCDNNTLNDVWDFCKYSIKATSFMGYYIDGDRERRPYEADALINQLGHYATDSYYSIGKRTCQYLIENPTWPTEWIMQTILIAWNDYLYSGDQDLLKKNYDKLKAHALFDLVDETCQLITTKQGQTSAFLSSLNLKNEIVDIVDWPHSDDPELVGSDFKGEDDGFIYTTYNSVVNAYHYKVVCVLADIAEAIGEKDDSKNFHQYADSFKYIYNKAFFDKSLGLYVDGVGCSHTSLHANMFPLAFDLVPVEHIDKVADFVVSRGVSCSVYGAQFLLEALYKARRADVALDYMTSQTERSWYNMIKEGSTISMEAWGNKYKIDQDWNHAWGAAPANIIPFYLLGVHPISKGFERVEIKPQIGWLQYAEGKIPTPKGCIEISVQGNKISLTLPNNIVADVMLPIPDYKYILFVNGIQVESYEQNGYVVSTLPVKGISEIELRKML